MRRASFIAAAAVITLAYVARADPTVRARARAAPPPGFIAGAGVGPAFARCDACDGTPGVGGRVFAIVPLIIPLGLGFTAEHERFFAPEGGYTFAGPMLVFSSGFGRTWQAELWAALGFTSSVVEPDVGPPDGGPQVGFRLGRRITPRTRLCVSISSASTFGFTSSGGGSSSGQASSELAAYVDGAVLLAAELAYDVAPARR